MSHIRFDNGEKHVLLRGMERHWMAQVINNVAMSALGIFDQPERPHWTRRTLPAGHYVLNSEYGRYEDDYKMWLRVGHEAMRHPVTGARMDTFAVLLNTAWKLGSTPVRLMARLHGQCEVHACVAPQDGHEVAAIIGEGRRIGLFRAGMGWEAVADFLRTSADEGRTVVTSYSVTETFPGWDGDKDEPKDWISALAALDTLNAITINGWADYRFGDGSTIMSLEADALDATEAAPARP